jgi:hypothetical protein
MVEKLDPERFKRLVAAHELEIAQRFAVYKRLAELTLPRSADAVATARAQVTAARAAVGGGER